MVNRQLPWIEHCIYLKPPELSLAHQEFLPQAEKGGILEVSRVKAAYEQALGRKVPKSTVYRMLARHGWRKVVPRPRHPKSDAATQAAFKKTAGNR